MPRQKKKIWLHISASPRSFSPYLNPHRQNASHYAALPTRTFPLGMWFHLPSFLVPGAPSIARPPTATAPTRCGIPISHGRNGKCRWMRKSLHCFSAAYRPGATVQHKNKGLKRRPKTLSSQFVADVKNHSLLINLVVQSLVKLRDLTVWGCPLIKCLAATPLVGWHPERAPPLPTKKLF